MRISDWSSDVCSSDLEQTVFPEEAVGCRFEVHDVLRIRGQSSQNSENALNEERRLYESLICKVGQCMEMTDIIPLIFEPCTLFVKQEIGIASCMERVGQMVLLWVVADSLKKKKN